MVEHPTPWKIQIVGKCGHVIDDLRDEVTAFAPADAAFWQRIVQAVNNHEKLVQAIREIKQATIDGRVCDDVAWFDAITTLHDFCDQTLALVAGGVGAVQVSGGSND